LGSFCQKKPAWLYFVQRGEDLIVLLAGGKKDTQARDIAQAIMLASEF
jgi:putative addiction module killer protein